jgi:glutathione S-transferase
MFAAFRRILVAIYSRKVMVALAEKELPYEQREILPKILLNATGQSIPADFEKQVH